MRRALLFVVLLPLLAPAQQTQKPDSWAPFQFFVGSWTGTGKGQPGISTLERQYQFILRGKFLQVTHKSAYKPQEKNPKGEVHEDLGFFSYDRRGKQYVFRQFHVEGFVTQYRSESISADGKTIVLVSEALENIPADFKARETYKILSADEFIETFELAEPGKGYEVYSENHFKRQR